MRSILLLVLLSLTALIVCHPTQAVSLRHHVVRHRYTKLLTHPLDHHLPRSRAFRGLPSSPHVTTIASAPSLEPSKIWRNPLPINLCYAAGILYVATAPALQVNPSMVLRYNVTATNTTGAPIPIPGNISYASTDFIWQLYCSPVTESVFALVTDLSTADQPLLVRQMNIHTGALVSSFALVPQLQLLLGVDPTGQRLLAASMSATGGATLLDATTGRQMGTLDGGVPNLMIGGGTFHPTDGSVLLLDARTNSMFGIATANNTVTLQVPLPDDLQVYGSIAIDHQGDYAWVVYSTSDLDRPTWNVFQQVELSTGRYAHRLQFDVPEAVMPAQLISPGNDDSPDQFWWLDQEVDYRFRPARIMKQSGNNATGWQLGNFSVIPLPSDIAALPNSNSMIVAIEGLSWVMEVNAEGQFVSDQPLDSTCSLDTRKRVAVDSASRILIPACNHSLLVYSQHGRLLNTVYVGPQSKPLAAAGGPLDTIYYVDDYAVNQISQVDLTTNRVLSVLRGPPTVHFVDVDVDLGAGMVWGADSGGHLLQFAMNGTTINNWDLTDPAGPTSVESVAVDSTNRRLIVSRNVRKNIAGEFVSTVLWLDMTLGTVIAQFTLPSGAAAAAVAVTADGRTVYAACPTTDAVIVWRSSRHAHTVLVESE